MQNFWQMQSREGISGRGLKYAFGDSFLHLFTLFRSGTHVGPDLGGLV